MGLSSDRCARIRTYGLLSEWSLAGLLGKFAVQTRDLNWPVTNLSFWHVGIYLGTFTDQAVQNVVQWYICGALGSRKCTKS